MNINCVLVRQQADEAVICSGLLWDSCGMGDSFTILHITGPGQEYFCERLMGGNPLLCHPLLFTAVVGCRLIFGYSNIDIMTATIS